jgi:hypothetical protein
MTIYQYFIIFFFFNVLCASFQSWNNQFFLQINDWNKPQPLVLNSFSEHSDNDVPVNVIQYMLKTPSGISVPMTLYDRNSDTVIVIAQALPATKEQMVKFVKIFPHYDIVVFDYRWAHNYNSQLIKSIVKAQAVKNILLNEIEELTTVVDFVVQKKNYTTVVGLGQCYSCFHLIKLQSERVRHYGHGPFTHLILDSAWFSLRALAKRICFDPLLPINPKHGGAPFYIRWITNSMLCKNLIIDLVFMFVKNISIKSYLDTVGIPVLFIHGSNDLFVPRKDFQKIWESANRKNRAVLFTPFEHVSNLRNKKMYCAIVEAFVSNKGLSAFIHTVG